MQAFSVLPLATMCMFACPACPRARIAAPCHVVQPCTRRRWWQTSSCSTAKKRKQYGGDICLSCLGNVRVVTCIFFAKCLISICCTCLPRLTAQPKACQMYNCFKHYCSDGWAFPNLIFDNLLDKYTSCNTDLRQHTAQHHRKISSTLYVEVEIKAHAEVMIHRIESCRAALGRGSRLRF